MARQLDELIENSAPTAPPVAAGADEPLYLNRELSLLDFQERVLALAEDDSMPLLERAKFLAIFAGNLDEFFQVRVAGLKDRLAAHLGATSLDGMAPAQQLAAIRRRVAELVARQSRTFLDRVVPDLAEAGIGLSHWEALDDDDRKQLEKAFVVDDGNCAFGGGRLGRRIVATPGITSGRGDGQQEDGE